MVVVEVTVTVSGGGFGGVATTKKEVSVILVAFDSPEDTNYEVVQHGGGEVIWHWYTPPPLDTECFNTGTCTIHIRFDLGLQRRLRSWPPHPRLVSHFSGVETARTELSEQLLVRTGVNSLEHV